MKALTREAAIQRIKELGEGENCEHLNPAPFDIWAAEAPSHTIRDIREIGALLELAHMFGIKEEELN